MASLEDLKASLTQYELNYAKNPRNFHVPIVTEKCSPVLIGAVYYHVLLKFVNRFSANLKELAQAGVNEDWENLKFDILSNLAKIIHGIPVQFTPETTIVEIHRTFIMSHESNSFITKRGQLTGMITRDGLKEVISCKTSPTATLIDIEIGADTINHIS